MVFLTPNAVRGENLKTKYIRFLKFIIGKEVICSIFRFFVTLKVANLVILLLNCFPAFQIYSKRAG